MPIAVLVDKSDVQPIPNSQNSFTLSATEFRECILFTRLRRVDMSMHLEWGSCEPPPPQLQHADLSADLVPLQI